MILFEQITKGDSRSVIVKKNILIMLLVKGCSIVISLLLVPITLGYVSSELYGIWLTLSSVVIWLNFFDVGFTLGLKNKLTEAIALGQWDRGKSLVSTAYFMMTIIFLPLCLLLELFIPFVEWALFLNVSEIYNTEIQKVMSVLVLCFCLQMIINVLSSVIAAFQKVALSSVFPVIGNFFSLIVIYLFTKLYPPSLLRLAVVISVMPILVGVVASVILFSSQFKKVAPSFKLIDRMYIKDLFSLGLRFFIIQIQVVVIFQTTNIAYKYIGIGLMVYNIILAPLWPAFTDAYTRKDYAWMRSMYSKMIKVYLSSVISIVFMVLVSPFVYELWIGDKAEISFLMTILVAVYVVLNSWDSLQVMILNGIGAVKLQVYVTMIGLICHIPLSLGIGNYIGGYGVVISMIIITLIYLSFFTVQVRKILNNKANGIWIK